MKGVLLLLALGSISFAESASLRETAKKRKVFCKGKDCPTTTKLFGHLVLGGGEGGGQPDPKPTKIIDAAKKYLTATCKKETCEKAAAVQWGQFVKHFPQTKCDKLRSAADGSELDGFRNCLWDCVSQGQGEFNKGSTFLCESFKTGPSLSALTEDTCATITVAKDIAVAGASADLVKISKTTGGFVTVAAASGGGKPDPQKPKPSSDSCSNPQKVDGISANLATVAQATPHRARLVGTMRPWAVCKLKDGQIDGPSHGGKIETKQQSGFDCSIECQASGGGGKPNVGPPRSREDKCQSPRLVMCSDKDASTLSVEKGNTCLRSAKQVSPSKKTSTTCAANKSRDRCCQIYECSWRGSWCQADDK